MKSSNGVLLCDFCGNSQHVVKTMVAGEHDSAICDECIDLCTEIMEEKRRESQPPKTSIIEVLKQKAKALRGS